MHIGQHIATLRLTRGWTQTHLADLSKMSASYISDIEAERRNPTTSTLKKLCAAFGMTLSEFYATSRFELSGVEAELLGLLRTQQWDKARAIIDSLEGV